MYICTELFPSVASLTLSILIFNYQFVLKYETAKWKWFSFAALQVLQLRSHLHFPINSSLKEHCHQSAACCNRRGRSVGLFLHHLQWKYSDQFSCDGNETKDKASFPMNTVLTHPPAPHLPVGTKSPRTTGQHKALPAGSTWGFVPLTNCDCALLSISSFIPTASQPSDDLRDCRTTVNWERSFMGLKLSH